MSLQELSSNSRLIRVKYRVRKESCIMYMYISIYIFFETQQLSQKISQEKNVCIYNYIILYSYYVQSYSHTVKLRGFLKMGMACKVDPPIFSLQPYHLSLPRVPYRSHRKLRGAWGPPILKKYVQVKLGIIFPKLRGRNKTSFETAT